MRRRHNRRRRNNQRKIIILSIMGLLFIMVAGYSAFQTNLNINAKGTIVERSRVIQSWTSSSNEDFHTDYYKENIVSATFLDSNVVPSDAVESWDVSVDKDKGVMAYVIANADDNTKYDLYIGANKGVIANEDSSFLFTNFTKIVSIEFNNSFDTSNTTTMKCMFMGCNKITKLDLSNFNTENVNDMGAMFSGWNNVESDNKTALIELDLSSFNTSNVTDMKDMFAYNQALKSIVGVENFDTSRVTNMWGVFYNCKSLANINLAKWDTSNVTNMRGMFYHCEGLTELDLCNFNTSKVTDMRIMFYYTTNLTKIKVGPNWTTENADDTTDMFTGSGVSDVTTGEC